jgi:hypothetical protein
MHKTVAAFVVFLLYHGGIAGSAEAQAHPLYKPTESLVSEASNIASKMGYACALFGLAEIFEIDLIHKINNLRAGAQQKPFGSKNYQHEIFPQLVSKAENLKARYNWLEKAISLKKQLPTDLYQALYITHEPDELPYLEQCLSNYMNAKDEYNNSTLTTFTLDHIAQFNAIERDLVYKLLTADLESPNPNMLSYACREKLHEALQNLNYTGFPVADLEIARSNLSPELYILLYEDNGPTIWDAAHPHGRLITGDLRKQLLRTIHSKAGLEITTEHYAKRTFEYMTHELETFFLRENQNRLEQWETEILDLTTPFQINNGSKTSLTAALLRREMKGKAPLGTARQISVLHDFLNQEYDFRASEPFYRILTSCLSLPMGPALHKKRLPNEEGTIKDLAIAKVVHNSVMQQVSPSSNDYVIFATTIAQRNEERRLARRQDTLREKLFQNLN